MVEDVETYVGDVSLLRTLLYDCQYSPQKLLVTFSGVCALTPCSKYETEAMHVELKSQTE